MALKIRLKAPIHKKGSTCRIVVTNIKNSRNGKSLENIGVYHKHRKYIYFNRNRFGFWLSAGAIPTKKVLYLLSTLNELPTISSTRVSFS